MPKKHGPVGMVVSQELTTNNGREYNKTLYVCPACKKEKLMVNYMMREARTFLVCEGNKQTRKNGIF